jgi:signal transduction histidine kinase
LIPPRFRAIHQEHVAEFAAGQETARRMGRRGTAIFGLRKNGEEFPADAAISKLDVNDKRIMTVSMRDITEQKRIEHEQKFLADVGPVLTSTLDYGETLKNIAQLAVRDLADFCSVDVVDQDGTVRRLKVLSRDPSKSWICDSLVKIGLDPEKPSLVRSVFQNHKTFLVERLSVVGPLTQSEEHLRLVQAIDPQSAMAVPLLAHGQLVGVISFVSSSPNRLYGPADVRVAEELAHRAALSIENARLFAEAQRAIKVREDILAIVSHDLKNPVSTIKLVAHIFGTFERIDPNRVKEFADKVRRSADEMDALINDLLDFARIQTGTFSIVTSPDRLSEVVMPVIERIRVQAEARHQKLEVDLPATLPEVAVDARRIGQVVSNLVGNSIKFTPEGGTIRVSARQQDGQIVVSVADTGPGIPQEHLPRIFDRFWQVPGTKKGSGLGLSIAKGIVEAHGGRIWAESQLGIGSTFFFTVPMANQDRTRRTDDAA